MAASGVGGGEDALELLRRAVPALGDVDEPVLSYLAESILSLTADDDEDAPSLVEATTGCELSAAERAAVHAAAERIAAAVAPDASGSSGGVASSPTSSWSPEPVAAAPLDLSAALVERRGGADTASEAGAAADTAAAAARDPSLEFLRALHPSASDVLLSHVLHATCASDASAAAEYLLERSAAELAALEREASAAHACRRERARAEERRERELRRGTVSRYGEVAVVAPDAPLAPPRLPYGAPKHGGGGPRSGRGSGPGCGAPAVRYREGEAVRVAKGEKYVVERPAEWDGGSRGRVKTKGKRGKGFA